MGEGFDVSPEDLKNAAKDLDSLSDQLTSTSDVLRSVSLDFNPSAFGVLVGQMIGVPVRGIIGEGAGNVKDSATSIGDGADVIRQTAREYEDRDVFPGS